MNTAALTTVLLKAGLRQVGCGGSPPGPYPPNAEKPARDAANRKASGKA